MQVLGRSLYAVITILFSKFESITETGLVTAVTITAGLVTVHILTYRRIAIINGTDLCLIIAIGERQLGKDHRIVLSSFKLDTKVLEVN